MTPVLVDFGLSGRQLRPGCGTLEYCAPEVIGVNVADGTPSPLAADIYAFACTAFELVSGEHLFYASDETALISLQISHDGWPEKLTQLGALPGLRELSVVLAACLRRDPRGRPSVSEVRRALAEVKQAASQLAWPCVPMPHEEQARA
jgi:eukaryotic-like serine/threonine-protein kinase